MGYIFETDFLDILVSNFITPNATRQEAVRCFQEIANLNVEGEEKEGMYREKIVLAYCNFIMQVRDITKGRNLYQEFQSVQGSQFQDGFEKFARQTALAITGVLVSNLTMIEKICG